MLSIPEELELLSTYEETDEEDPFVQLLIEVMSKSMPEERITFWANAKEAT